MSIARLIDRTIEGILKDAQFAYDYIIYTDGTNIFAFNTKTKQIEFVSTDATQVYSYVFNKSNISVKIKGGSYNTNPVLAQNVNDITIDGDGMGNTVITLNAGSGNPNVFGFSSCNNITIRNLSINVNGQNQTNQPTEGTRGIEIVNSNNVLVEYVEVYNHMGAGIKIYGGSRIKVKHCYGHGAIFNPNLNVNPSDIEIGASDYITNYVWVEENYVTSKITTFGGGTSGATNYVLIKGNIINGIDFTTAYQPLISIGFTNYIDIKDNIILVINNNVMGIQIGSSTQVNIEGNIIIASATIFASYGINILSDTPNVIIKGNQFYRCFNGIQLNANYNVVEGNLIVYSGNTVYLNNSSKNVVRDNIITQGGNQIQEVGTSDYNLYDGNIFHDTTGYPPILFVGVHSKATNNKGYNDTLTPTSITVGASPFVYQNKDNVEEDIIISGGTVSSLAWSRDGSTYYNLGLTSGVFHLEPGEYLQVTYTAAPTMTKVPL